MMMEQKLDSKSQTLESPEIKVLKRSLERQKKARLQAEEILERKSKELYNTSLRLKETNERLGELLEEKSNELEGVFITIIDPYVMFKLNGEIFKMNQAAINYLGYSNKEEQVNIKDIIDPVVLDCTVESLSRLIEADSLRNFRTKIITKSGEKKTILINANLIYDNKQEPIAAQGIIRDITQEEEIKVLLSEQRRELDFMVEDSPLGIVLIDNGNIVKVNKAIRKYLGYNIQEFQNMKLEDITEEVENSNHNIKLGDGEQQNYTSIRNYRRKDNGIITCKTSVQVIKDEFDNTLYEVAIIEDITQMMIAEKKRLESEQRLSALVGNLHLGIRLENKNHAITLTNLKFCEFFDIGDCPESIINRHSIEIEHLIVEFLENPDEYLAARQRILKRGKASFENIMELGDGRVFEYNYIPIEVSKGNIEHLWVYADVTVQHRYERTIELQKEKYSRIIANMNIGLVEINKNDIIEFANQSFCDLSGLHFGDIIGKGMTQLLKVGNEDQLIERAHSRQREISDSYELMVQNNQGEWRHWMISGAPNYDDAGQIIGSIGIILDITEEKHLQDQKEKLLKDLAATNESLSEYAHVVSHDLKSPLRGLNALLTWMKEDYSDVLDEGGLNNLRMMDEKVESMENLINGILTYSSIQNKPLHNTLTDMNVVIKEITDMIFIPDHVRVEIPEKLPSIIADKTRMHQLFQNILTNATAHIDKEVGIVQVKYEEFETEWRFSIIDNGKGIPEEYKNKIFEIFQTIGNSKHSTGIGLSIVKKIVKMYKGVIELESEVGKGTDFSFTITKDL